MIDEFGRDINYLRLSITDNCNYRCCYCMPNCENKICFNSDLMSVDELVEISKAFIDCGIRKIRLTGGEPLLRNDILNICDKISNLDNLEELCITTNGSLLSKYALGLAASGVSRINISLDTLDANKYKFITKGGDLSQVLKGIESAEKAGFDLLKLNVVLINGFNNDEIDDFVAITKDKPCEVRFIELMPIGNGIDMWRKSYIPVSEIIKKVPSLVYKGRRGVANIYNIPGYKGTVGLIEPIHNKFCGQCNRLRVTSDGKLKSCLHSVEEINIRGNSDNDLRSIIKDSIVNKPFSHLMCKEGKSRTHRSMNMIGG